MTDEKTDVEIKAAAAKALGAADREVTDVEPVADGVFVTLFEGSIYHVSDDDVPVVTYVSGPVKDPSNLRVGVYAGDARPGDGKAAAKPDPKPPVTPSKR